jgi:hypothetical protein
MACTKLIRSSGIRTNSAAQTLPSLHGSQLGRPSSCVPNRDSLSRPESLQGPLEGDIQPSERAKHTDVGLGLIDAVFP